mmetsp:Transcript_5407/g.8536  ORF Transcript_5407/g.8536 Transcript_5407/m.8536 type:complete len:213 (+) Transcript_5407:124-762(+)|eukprot:CAMPEP_0178757826 /NCGR_PEP_ID=MMETSP0744-20121128/14028_1 /TAXON_ID=913974 /ORGANISM="Nitzschia punctata, Strain CCMP561" /LENGTH=212 /DNA_ID=CAMNT_0020412087 /DNA_START=121 /DNA_END=759 /DNA_ORIENTATION=-
MMMPRFFPTTTSSSVTLALVSLFAVLPTPLNGQGGLIPDGLLDFIPPDCLPVVEESLIPCALTNLCLDLIPSPDEIESIPAPANVTQCSDISTPLCPIINRCPPCFDFSVEVFKCIILNSTEVPPDVISLVEGCSLDCDETTTDAPTPMMTGESATSPPTAAPAGPTDTTSAPTVAEAATEPPTSGTGVLSPKALTFLTGAVIAFATSFGYL